MIPAIATALSDAGARSISIERDESHLSPSASVQYLGFENTMLFASAGTGYKAGGYDDSGLFLLLWRVTSANQPLLEQLLGNSQQLIAHPTVNGIMFSLFMPIHMYR